MEFHYTFMLINHIAGEAALNQKLDFCLNVFSIKNKSFLGILRIGWKFSLKCGFLRMSQIFRKDQVYNKKYI